MHHTRRPVAVVVIALICAWVGFCYMQLRVPPWQSQVSLSFSGYTNDYGGARMARFVLHNESRVTIRATPFCDREGRNHEVLVPRPGLTNISRLPTKSLWTFDIPAPSGQEPWRLALLCDREGPRSRLSDWVNQSRRIRALIPQRWRGVPSEFIKSGWVEQ
jgi:hypothetical protein